jgi:iron complex outermembrane receptor protein
VARAQADEATASSSTAAQQNEGLQEIVVTARKREEKEQSIPLAISAFGSVDIERQQIERLSDLQNSVPGLFWQPTSADRFGSLMSLRGVTTQNILQSLDPSVAVYVDGLYQGASGANMRDQDDIQRIEVLKGPQGTLFGRNSTGGAISIVHNLPTDTLEGWVRAGVGNYGERSGAALINLPLVSNLADLRVLGSYDDNEGYGHDFGPVNTGQPFGNVRSGNLNTTLRITPTDKLEILLRGFYNDGSSGGNAQRMTYVVPGSLANGEVYQDLNPGLPPGAGYACLAAAGSRPAGCAAAAAQAVALANSYGFYNSASAFKVTDRAKKDGGSATINYAINDDLSLKSITGYIYSFRYINGDLAGSVFPVGYYVQDTFQDQFSQELTLNGIAFAQRLNYTLGGYYYDSKGQDNQEGLFALNLAGVGGPYKVRTTQKSFAPYAQATYEIVPKLHVTAGIRYTKDKKTDATVGYALSGGVTTCASGTNAQCIAPFESETFPMTSYLLEFDYQVLQDLMVYVKTSRGSRSGGVQETAPGRPGFAPENLTDYELGEKAEFFDHRLRVNFDIYHSIYQDLQQTVYAVDPNGVVYSAIINAASAHVEGAELQATVQPVRSLTLSAMGAYTHPYYLSFSTADQGDISNTPFANVSRYSYTLGGDYTKALGAAGTLNLHLDYHWQSEITSGTVPTIATISEGGRIVDGITGQTAYGIINGRLSFNLNSDDVEVALWGRNLGGKHYYSYVGDFTGSPEIPSIGYVAATVGDPRTFGLTVTKRF